MTEMGEMTREAAVTMRSHHPSTKKAHQLKKEVEVSTEARMRPHTD